MNDSLISVIVPCYNVENYFAKCIDSILGQSYKNLEIIIVDDGSTDNTGALIRKYKKQDSRIISLKQKNAGLSAARNSGIRIAKGEYICFIDSDDYVAKNYIEDLHHSLVETGSDICACNYYYVEDGGIKVRASGPNQVFSAYDGLTDLFSGTQKTGIVVWNKLYKKALFDKNNIFFPHGKIHEDNFTTYKLYYYSRKIYYLNKPLYYYVQRDNSIMGNSFEKKRMQILEAYDETVSFFKEHKVEKDLRDYLICYQAFIYVNLYNKIIRSDYTGGEKKFVRDRIVANRKKYYLNKPLCVKLKTMVVLITFLPGVYRIIAKRKGGK